MDNIESINNVENIINGERKFKVIKIEKNRDYEDIDTQSARKMQDDKFYYEYKLDVKKSAPAKHAFYFGLWALAFAIELVALNTLDFSASDELYRYAVTGYTLLMSAHHGSELKDDIKYRKWLKGKIKEIDSFFATDEGKKYLGQIEKEDEMKALEEQEELRKMEKPQENNTQIETSSHEEVGGKKK